MNANKVKNYLLNKPEAWEDFPFGPDAAVYKIETKIFALLFQQNGQDKLNLKCDPQQARELRDVFDAVQPGYHMNKTHWNTVILDGSLPAGEIQRMIDHSYSLVVKSLKKAVRQGLEIRHGKEKMHG